MVVFSKFKSNQNYLFIGAGSVCAIGLLYSLYKDLQKLKGNPTDKSKPKSIGNNKVNIEFFKRLKCLLMIIFPKIITKESLLLLFHTAFLIIRTFITIFVADVESKLVKSIVQRDVNKFLIELIKFLLISLPATFVNSLIKFMEKHLALAFRSKLVNKFYSLYFDKEVYYRIENLDNRIKNVDQSLTEDISNFASSLAHLYSQVTKPFLDLCLMNISLFKLAKYIGADIKIPVFIAISIVASTGELLRILSPKFGLLIAEEAERKGYLRFLHSRIIQNSEEIAFYNGAQTEATVLNRAYNAVVSQTKKIWRQKLWYITLEQFLMKYMWSAAGLFMVSIPIITATGLKEDGTYVDNDADGGVSERTKSFTMARNLLINSAAALERMISSYKEITELSGYTTRVYNILQVFHDLSRNKYVNPGTGNYTSNNNSCNQIKDSQAMVQHVSNYIELIEVPIITPNGDCVLNSLNIKIEPNDHMFITGPNGCGKSSLFRIFNGLWPIYGGSIYLPDPKTMYHIPQKPYMFLGNLRDQIIYPDTIEKMRDKGIGDDDLIKILEIVELGHILAREGGFDTEKDWINVLSGGEKQRIGMSRLFYHRPKFALLDECTSAVSIDIESKIYEELKLHGMTLLTITHRPSLRKFHNRILEFDGEGKYTINKLVHDTQDKVVLNGSSD